MVWTSTASPGRIDANGDGPRPRSETMESPARQAPSSSVQSSGSPSFPVHAQPLGSTAGLPVHGGGGGGGGAGVQAVLLMPWALAAASSIALFPVHVQPRGNVSAAVPVHCGGVQGVSPMFAAAASSIVLVPVHVQPRGNVSVAVPVHGGGGSGTVQVAVAAIEPSPMHVQLLRSSGAPVHRGGGGGGCVQLIPPMAAAAAVSIVLSPVHMQAGGGPTAVHGGGSVAGVELCCALGSVGFSTMYGCP
jgi:hypothetical protein